MITWLDHVYSEEVRLVVWISLWIISYTVGILLLCGFSRFRRLKSLMIIQKRYPDIVMLESKFSIVLSFMLIPLFQCTHSDFEIFIYYQKYIDILTYLIYPVCHFIVGCEVCRLWLMCYDLNYLHNSKNNEWKSQIDNKLLNINNNWWLNNENRIRYGNSTWVKKRLFIWCLTTATISCILYQVWEWTPITQAVDTILYGTPISFMLFAYYRCPSINDKFLFMIEFKSSSIIFTTALALYFLGEIILFFDIFIAKSLITFAGLYGLSAVSMLSTLWIPKKIISSAIWHKELNKHIEVTIGSSNSSKDGNKDKDHDIISILMTLSTTKSSHNHDVHHPEIHRQKSRENKNKKPRIRLTHILSNKHALELFAIHLSAEFSLECLLSFIEVVQYKIYFQNIIYNNSKNYIDNIDNHKIKDKIKLSFDKPLKSSIVYDTFKEPSNYKSYNSSNNNSRKATPSPQPPSPQPPSPRYRAKSYSQYDVDEEEEHEINITNDTISVSPNVSSQYLNRLPMHDISTINSSNTNTLEPPTITMPPSIPSNPSIDTTMTESEYQHADDVLVEVNPISPDLNLVTPEINPSEPLQLVETDNDENINGVTSPHVTFNPKDDIHPYHRNGEEEEQKETEIEPPDLPNMVNTNSDQEIENDELSMIKNFKIVALKLYKKYIRTYAELEINISSECRTKYYELMEDEQEWINNNVKSIEIDDLYSLYDDVIMEMFKLMDNSLTRFLTSSDFLIFQEQMKIATNNTDH